MASREGKVWNQIAVLNVKNRVMELDVKLALIKAEQSLIEKLQSIKFGDL